MGNNAEDTAQVAETKENRPTPAPASETVLFAEVRKRRAHGRVPAGSTDPLLILQAIDATIARANAALFELLNRGLDLPFDGALTPSTKIGGLEVFDDEASCGRVKS